MWSFVGNKGNKQWIWLAIDVLTKEIVGVYIGKRDKDGARGLGNSLPAVYRQCAVSYTDFCPCLWDSFS
jgi:IS1 family transposase